MVNNNEIFNMKQTTRSVKTSLKKFEYKVKADIKVSKLNVDFVPCLKSVSKAMNKTSELTPILIKVNEKRRDVKIRALRDAKIVPQALPVSFDPAIRAYKHTREFRIDLIRFYREILISLEFGRLMPFRVISSEFRAFCEDQFKCSIPSKYFSDFSYLHDEIHAYSSLFIQCFPSSREIKRAIADVTYCLAQTHADLVLYEAKFHNDSYLNPAREFLRLLEIELTWNFVEGRLNIIPQSRNVSFNGDIAIEATRSSEKKSIFSIMHKVYDDYSDGKLQSTVNSISDVLDRVEDAVKRFPSEEVSALLAEIRVFVQAEKERESKNETSPYMSAAVVIFIATSVMALKYKKPIFMIFSIASGSFVLSQIDFAGLCRKYNFLQICYNGVTNMMGKFLNSETVPQASDDEIKEASDCLGMLYSFFVLSTVKQENLTEGIYKKITMFDRFSNNLSTMIKIIVGMAEKVFNTVISHLSPSDNVANRVRWLTTNNVEVEEFMTKAQDIIDRYHGHRLVYSRFNYELVTKIRDEGLRLSKEYAKGNHRSKLPNLFSVVMKSISEIHKEYSSFNYTGTGLRPEPALLNLVGKAGIGKSMLSRQMTDYLLYKILVNDGMEENDKASFIEDARTYIFNRNPGSEYWDTFTSNTKICVWDDIFQYVDYLGSKICEALEIIRAKNMERFPVPIAFEGKNKIFFNADLMVLNANDVLPKIEQIYCQEALFRRLNTGTYIVYPRDEYCSDDTIGNGIEDRQIDFNKVPKDQHERAYVSLDCHWFQRVKYRKDGSGYSHVGYPQTAYAVIKQIEEDIAENKARYLQQLEIMKSLRELSVYDVENNLSILHHAPDLEIYNIPQANNVFFDQQEHAKYVETFKVFENEEEIDNDMYCGNETILWDNRTLSVLNTFVKKYENTDGKTSVVDNIFIYNLFRDYVRFNVMDEDKVIDVKPQAVFMSYFSRFGEYFIDSCNSTDVNEKNGFIDQTRMSFANGVKLSYRYHNTMTPKSSTSTAVSCLCRWKSYVTDLMTNPDSWHFALWKWIKEHIIGNPTLLAIIAAGPIIYYALDKLDNMYGVFNIKGWTEAGEYANWNKKLPGYDTYVKWFGEPYLPKGTNFYGFILDRDYLHSEIFSPGPGIPYPDCSPYWKVQVKPQSLDEFIEKFKQEIEVGIREKDLKKRCMEISMMLAQGIISAEEHGQAIYEAVEEWESVNGCEAQSVNVKFRGKVKQKEINKPGHFDSNIQPQAVRGLDFNGCLILEKVMNQNSYSLELPSDRYGNSNIAGSILYLIDKFAFIPTHYVSIMKENANSHGDIYTDLPLSLLQNGGEFKSIKHTTTVKKFLDICDKGKRIEDTDDGLIIRIDSSIFDIPIGTRSNVLKFIATKEQYNKLVSVNSGALILASPKGLSSIINPYIKKIDNLNTPIYKDKLGQTLIVRNGFEYHSKTKLGDCGGILALDKTSLNCTRIFGIHVSGDETIGVGYSQALFSDKIEKVIKEFGDNMVVNQAFNEVRPQCFAKIADGQFTPIEILDKPVPINVQTKLMKSPLYGCLFPAREMPAPLKKQIFNGEVTDPWDHNLKKFCKAKVLVDDSVLEDICEQILIDLEKMSPINVERRSLTVEEAVLGEDHFDLGSIPRDTSVGYPEVLNPKPGFPKRTRYFGKEEAYDLINTEFPKLREDLEQYIEDCKNCVRSLEILAIDNLKDETNSIQKIIEKLKSRVFNAYSLLKQIADKMYLGAFTSWLKKNRIFNMNACGVNVYSAEWDSIARKLLQFGSENVENVKDVDYACFDGSENARILQKICMKIIAAWYNKGDEYDRIVYMLCLEVFDSYHVRGNIVYQWNGGMTSGSFLTLTFNFLYNLVNFYYSWYKLHDFDRSCLPKFRSNVYPIIMGDDNTFTVSLNYIDKFTASWIQQSSKDIGLNITAASKTGDIGGFVKLTDTTFLKRKFRYCKVSGRYVGAIDLDSILETLYWVRNKDEVYTTTCSNVDLVLKELALHGEETFNYWERRISVHAYERIRYVSDFRSYRAALKAVLDMDIFV